MSKTVIKDDIKYMLTSLVSTLKDTEMEEDYNSVIADIYSELDNLPLIDLYVTRQYIKDSINSINADSNIDKKNFIGAANMKVISDAAGNFFVVKDEGGTEKVIFQTNDEQKAKEYIETNKNNPAMAASPEDELSDDVSEDLTQIPKDDLPNTKIKDNDEEDELMVDEGLNENEEEVDPENLELINTTLDRANNLVSAIDNSIDVVPDLSAITDLVNIKVTIQDKIDELSSADPNDENLDTLIKSLESELEENESKALDIINKNAPGSEVTKETEVESNKVVSEDLNIEEDSVEIDEEDEIAENIEDVVDESEELEDNSFEESLNELDSLIEQMFNEPAEEDKENLKKEILDKLNDLKEEADVEIDKDESVEEEFKEELVEDESDDELDELEDKEPVVSDDTDIDEDEDIDIGEDENIDYLEEDGKTDEEFDKDFEDESNNIEDEFNEFEEEFKEPYTDIETSEISDLIDELTEITEELKEKYEEIDESVINEEPSEDMDEKVFEDDIPVETDEEFIEEEKAVESSTLNPFDWESLEDGEKKDTDLESDAKISDSELIPKDDGVQEVEDIVVKPEPDAELPLEGENPLEASDMNNADWIKNTLVANSINFDDINKISDNEFEVISGFDFRTSNIRKDYENKIYSALEKAGWDNEPTVYII